MLVDDSTIVRDDSLKADSWKGNFRVKRLLDASDRMPSVASFRASGTADDAGRG